MGFLPVTLSEIKKLGVQQADFIIVTGDAYVDHPSFGAAIIGRLLESLGYVIGIIAQPDWKNIESFKKLGKPKYAFMVTGGNIDSMVNHYSVAKKRRHTEVYSPGGKVGLRPDRASIVYSNKIREAYKDAFIVLGGIEASLRRLAHYDYWDDTVRRSILVDSGADILIYGMAETQVEELAEGLKSNFDIKKIRGICYKAKTAEGIENSIVLPSFVKVSRDKDKYCESFMLQYNNSHGIIGKTLIEPYPSGFVVQTPPALPISTAKFDKVYALPYMKAYHPDYESLGGVPAISEVKFSIISNRGCFGSCNFCALTFHQGRVVQARSHASILKEAGEFKWDSDFKGYIHDVGGPTANFRKPACKKQLSQGPCINKECLFPTPCENLDTSHEDYLKLLKSLREVDGVKKVFVRSGIRYDYLLEDTNGKFLKELVKHHISGQLKVAPEHISDKVLEKMGKPGRNVYKKFCEKYAQINNSLGMKQFLVPYFMSSHPGSDLAAAVELAEYLRDTGFTPEQVQDFYPTPGTLSTCMYFTGKDPRTMKTVYVPKTSHEKTLQRALMQYKNPKNYYLVRDALINAGREDLIGDGNRCLISHKPFVAPKANKSKKVGDKTVIDNKGKYNVSKSKSQKKKTIRNIHKSKKS